MRLKIVSLFWSTSHLQTATIKSTSTKDCPPSCLLRVTFARNAEGGREGDEVPPILLKFLNARRDRLFSLVGWGVGWGGWGVRWVQWGGRRCKGKILHDRTRRKQKAMASRKVLKNTYGKTKKCRKLTGEEKNCCVEIILPPPCPPPPPHDQMNCLELVKRVLQIWQRVRASTFSTSYWYTRTEFLTEVRKIVVESNLVAVL